LPASVRENFLKTSQPTDSIPMHAAHCPTFHDKNRLELVYPVHGIKIFVPRDLDGEYEKIVFSANHHQESSHLFWYLNGSFIQETVRIHQFSLDIDPGLYKLTVQDEAGYIRKASFTVYKKSH
jgi:penicillin-binding protein 1C